MKGIRLYMGDKRMYKVLLPIVCLFIYGCSNEEKNLQTELNRFVGKPFVGEFKIIKSEYTFAIGDDVNTLEVEFTNEGMKDLIATIQGKNLNVVEKGWQYSKTIPQGEGFDFFLLSYGKDSRNIQIQYGHE